MRCVIYFYDEYTYREKLFSRNLPLNDLFEFLRDNRSKDSFIKFEEDKKDHNKVMIWSKLNIKKPLELKDFATDEEFWAYVDRYHQYSRKHLAEMPAIRISRNNYEELENQWKEIRKHKPKYLIFREHDNGYVDILEKNELSDEDIANMNRENKIYLNYLKRWNEYKKTHPEKLYPIWRCPADNFFESDFALYDPADELGID